MNPNSRNGVYSNDGNRIGYAVRNPSGVTNFFTNDGSRIGYIPAPEEDYRPQPFYGSGAPERPQRHTAILDDDDDYPPPRRAPTRVKQGFTPLAQPRGRFTPIEEVEPGVQVRGRFTPIEQYEPVRSGFTPLTPPKPGFTPIK